MVNLIGLVKCAPVCNSLSVTRYLHVVDFLESQHFRSFYLSCLFHLLQNRRCVVQAFKEEGLGMG